MRGVMSSLVNLRLLRESPLFSCILLPLSCNHYPYLSNPLFLLDRSSVPLDPSVSHIIVKISPLPRPSAAMVLIIDPLSLMLPELRLGVGRMRSSGKNFSNVSNLGMTITTRLEY